MENLYEIKENDILSAIYSDKRKRGQPKMVDYQLCKDYYTLLIRVELDDIENIDQIQVSLKENKLKLERESLKGKKEVKPFSIDINLPNDVLLNGFDKIFTKNKILFFEFDLKIFDSICDYVNLENENTFAFRALIPGYKVECFEANLKSYSVSFSGINEAWTVIMDENVKVGFVRKAHREIFLSEELDINKLAYKIIDDYIEIVVPWKIQSKNLQFIKNASSILRKQRPR